MGELAKCNNILLFKQLMEGDDDDDVVCETATPDQNLCLITNDKLDSNSIKLECNHQFNYEPLYNEVVYQKTKKLLDNSKLKVNEMKCPYCRKVNNGILPWYEGYMKIKNVNWSNKIIQKKCLALLKSGKRKGKTCDCKAKEGNFCGRHIKKLI